MTVRLTILFIAVFASSAFAQPTNGIAGTTSYYKSLSLDELMSMSVTSVSRQPEPYSSAPAALQVVTGDDIRRYGASDFPEALRLADNLYIAQRSSAGWGISARGFNASVGNKLLVLMDGRIIYTPIFSGVIWNNQDYLLNDIDRIEVVSGPGGTLWGENAVNGVINIVSKDARDTQGLYLEGGGGTWLKDFGGVRYGGTLATNVYYRVYGKYFDRGPEVFNDGSSAQDPWNRGQGGFRIDDYRSQQNKLTLQGDFYAGETRVVPGGEGTPAFNGNTSGGNFLSRWTHTIHDDSDLVLQTYYDYAHLAAPFQSAPAIPAGIYRNDVDTFDINFQHRFTFATRNRFIWGAEYRFYHYTGRDAPLVAFVPGTQNYNVVSAFLQDEIELPQNVFLTLGTKIEHNDYTGFEVEPNIRLHWHPTERQMWWGAISRAVRTPARYDRDLFEPNPQFGTFLGTSNSNFRSESVIAYELGYRAELGHRVTGSISGYYNDYYDLRTIGLTHGGLPVVFQNDLEGYTYGVELSTSYQATDRWRLHFGYDYLIEHLRVKSGAFDIAGGHNETADPRHQVFVRSSIDLPANFELSGNLRLIDQIQVNNGSAFTTVPAYAELDARIAWHATKNLEISLVGQNLLHDYHAEGGFPGPSQESIVRGVYGKIALEY